MGVEIWFGFGLVFLCGVALGYALALADYNRRERRRLDELLYMRGRLGWRGTIQLPVGRGRPKLPASVVMRSNHDGE